MSKPKPRKRYKLECLECHSVFDDDYRKKHERNCHEGKRMRVAHKNAPSNPWTASIKPKRSRREDGEVEAQSQSFPEDKEQTEVTEEVSFPKKSEVCEDGKSSSYTVTLNTYSPGQIIYRLRRRQSQRVADSM